MATMRVQNDDFIIQMEKSHKKQTKWMEQRMIQLERQMIDTKSKMSDALKTAEVMTSKQESAQTKCIQLLRELKGRDTKNVDKQVELEKALIKASEQRYKKQQYKTEMITLRKLCEELTENLREAELLHEKHMEIIA